MQGTHPFVFPFRIQGHGIVTKSWSARPIACFVRGNEHARVELSHRDRLYRSRIYDTPTFDCLATTGPHMSKETSSRMSARDCLLALPSIHMGTTRKLWSSRSTKAMNSEEHCQSQQRLRMLTTTVDTFFEPAFHMLPFGSSTSIRRLDTD